MTNIAVVNRVINNQVYIMHLKEYDKKEATERSFWKINPRDFRALNSKQLDLKSGDMIEYYIPEGKTIFASFTVLILPLIIFLLTFILLENLGLSSVKLKALISIAAMFSSFYIHKAVRKLGFRETLPTIIRKVDRDQLLKYKKRCKECGSCTACN